jgi:RNA polymerase-binding protein DksA
MGHPVINRAVAGLRKKVTKKKLIGGKKSPTRIVATSASDDDELDLAGDGYREQEDEEQFEVPPLEERISKKDLDEITGKLLARRRELIGSIGLIESEYLGQHDNVTTKGGDEADQASTALTADISLRLAESESRELQEIEVALAKLKEGSYGICEATGKPIDVRRLRFLPSARLSLEAQKRLEQNQLFYDEVAGWVAHEEGAASED